MFVAMSTHMMQYGFVPQKKCVLTVVLCHLCHVAVTGLRQTHRSNMPADTPSEYYCWSITIPMLDHLISELKTTYGNHQKCALVGLSVVSSVLISLSLLKKQTHTFANLHNTVMTCHHISASELHSRQLKWQQQATEHRGDNHAHTHTTQTRLSLPKYPCHRTPACYASCDNLLSREVL